MVVCFVVRCVLFGVVRWRVCWCGVLCVGCSLSVVGCVSCVARCCRLVVCRLLFIVLCDLMPCVVCCLLFCRCWWFVVRCLLCVVVRC